MWRDEWQNFEATIAATIGVADAAIRTSVTLLAVVISTALLALLWWYLLRRGRKRD